MSGENKGPIQSVRFISRGGTALAAVMMLSLAVAAAFAQSYVPPTAREAASLPAFASRLAHRGSPWRARRRVSPTSSSISAGLSLCQRPGQRHLRPSGMHRRMRGTSTSASR